MFVFEYTAYKRPERIVFKAWQHTFVAVYSVLFAHYIVLNHISERARIRHEFGGVKVVVRGRRKTVHGARAQPYERFAKQVEVLHFGYGNAL